MITVKELKQMLDEVDESLPVYIIKDTDYREDVSFSEYLNEGCEELEIPDKFLGECVVDEDGHWIPFEPLMSAKCECGYYNSKGKHICDAYCETFEEDDADCGTSKNECCEYCKCEETRNKYLAKNGKLESDCKKVFVL